jgi:hypothetical protein
MNIKKNGAKKANGRKKTPTSTLNKTFSFLNLFFFVVDTDLLPPFAPFAPFLY